MALLLLASLAVQSADTGAADLARAFAQQLQPCIVATASPGPGAERIRSVLRVELDRAGTPVGRPQLLRQDGVDNGNRRYAARLGARAADAIMACAPYRLPAASYENGWRRMTITVSLPDHGTRGTP